MGATALFDNDLTPIHVLGPEETSELEGLAERILQKTNISTLSVLGFEDHNNRDSLRTSLFSANSSLNLDDRIERHYLPPQPYFDIGGTILREGKDHPLYVFQEMGLFTNEELLSYSLVMGQLIESVERMVMKGSSIMGRESSAFDLFGVSEDTSDEKEQVSTMKGSEKGRLLMEEQGVSRYHSALGFLSKHLGRFSARLKQAFDESQEGVPKAWEKYRQHLQQRSDEGFAKFMGDYESDLKRATECMKLAYSMTRQLLGVVSNEESLKRVTGTVHMALHPREYKKAMDAGIKHLKMVDQVLSHYVTETRVLH